MAKKSSSFVVILFTLLTATISGQDADGLPGVASALGVCLYCQVAVVESQLTNGQGLKAYRCLTRETQEGDGESEMSYTLNLPDSFINANKAKLDTGISNICILGGSAIRNDLSKPDFVVIPSRASITFVESSARHVRRLAQTGTRTTLIVRVTSSTESVPDSAVFLANAAFGVGGQPYSMSAQFNSCSAGKLNFVPASGFGIITNGVMELSLSATVVGVNIFDLENPMTIAVSALLGIPSLSAAFSNVIFCMPFGTTFLAGGSNQWFAYAYRPGKFSYYNNDACSSLSAKMHEVGHNLGLYHSNEGTEEYGDKSCMMGYSYYGSGFPAMCFNGHKNYILGWYADRQITVDPAVGGPWLGKLVGFVDYTETSVSRNEYVLIVVGQLYIQYNLAEDFNFETQEKPNMVTITTAPNTSSPSLISSAIALSQVAVVGLYTIEVCAMVAAAAPVPKYLILSIRLNSQPSSCGGTIAPITLAPTTTAPNTAAPTTAAPVTAAPTTAAPVTAAPTTVAPTTVAPTTAAPTTAAPTTTAPTTAAPTTTAPTTTAPTTTAPTTAAPTTAAPTTTAPTTAAPTTAAPTTAAPTTAAPTTAAPVTAAPTTAAPTTAAPVTAAPTTAAPTTAAPVTAAPTTAAPTTTAPTTAAPTTAPTTAAPTTAAPTTAAPTTAAPTTAAPTTAAPTTRTPTTRTPTTTAPTTRTPTTTAPTTRTPTTTAPTTRTPTTTAPTTRTPTTIAPTTRTPTTRSPTKVPTMLSPTKAPRTRKPIKVPVKRSSKP